MPLPLAGALFGRNAARGLAGSASGLRGAASGVAIGMRVSGAKDIQRAFRDLDLNSQRKILRPPTRKATEIVHAEILNNINGRILTRHRGILWGAFADTKISLRNSRRGGVAGIIPFPTREMLGIDKTSPHFWPAAIEFGHPRARAHPYIRPAIDDRIHLLESVLGRGIANGVLRVAGSRGTFRRGATFGVVRGESVQIIRGGRF